MSACQPACLSVCVCLSATSTRHMPIVAQIVSVCLPACLSLCLSVCYFHSTHAHHGTDRECLPASLPVSVSFCLLLPLYTCPSWHRSCLSVSLPACLPVSLSAAFHIHSTHAHHGTDCVCLSACARACVPACFSVSLPPSPFTLPMLIIVDQIVSVCVCLPLSVGLAVCSAGRINRVRVRQCFCFLI